MNFDGTKMRPWDTAEEGDAAMVERWNSVVGDNDKVIHLGDVAIPRRGLKVLEQLKGRKVLIRGNHDIFKLQTTRLTSKTSCRSRRSMRSI